MSEDKRRYPRVHFRGDIGQAFRIWGAKATWANQEVSDVFDLSFKGMAATRPGLVDLKVGALQSLKLELGERVPVLIPARVVWVSDQLVGLEFGDVSSGAHLHLDAFLTDKLVGQYMRPVGKEFFSKDVTFDYWFQGPKVTHLFLWCDKEDPSKVIRVILDFDGSIWEFENRRVVKGDDLNERAIQILGQITVTEFRLKDVIEKVATLA
jgi:hypothetical protein